MEAAGICREVGREARPPATPRPPPDPHAGDSRREALRDEECMSDPPKVGALRMLPASKHRTRGGSSPLSWGCHSSQNPGPETTPTLRAGTPTDRVRVGGGASMRLGISGVWDPLPGWSPWAGSRGSPLPAVLPAPAPVPQPASVGGEFLPLSFLAPIGRCHLGSVGRQARRWPWGGRW